MSEARRASRADRGRLRARRSGRAALLAALATAAAVSAAGRAAAQEKPAQATEPPGAPLPAFAFPRPFSDLGPLRLRDGTAIMGSDPEIDRGQDGRWYLHRTWGPTKPGIRDLRFPGIYQHVADRIEGPYGPTRIVLRADTPGGGALIGMETVSVTWVPPLEKWIGLVHTYEAHKTNNKLCVFTARALDQPFELTGVCVAPELPWERPWQRTRELEGGCYSEPGLVYSEAYRMLLACYGALGSRPDGVAWRIGLMASRDDGATWRKHPLPILVPPARFTDPSGINMASHGCLVDEPRLPGALHLFAVWSGRVGPDRKGIAHWFFDGVRWHVNPHGLLLTSADTLMGQVGGPSVVYDPERRRWMMVYHAEAKGRGIRRHLRLAVVDE